MTDTLEAGFTALDEFTFLLGGVASEAYDGHPLRPVVDAEIEGLEDLGEVEEDGDGDGAGDGEAIGFQRLAARSIIFPHHHDEDVTTFAADLDAIRRVLSLGGVRYGSASLRLLRWRFPDEPAKRLWVKPSVGKPLVVPGTEQRLLWGKGARILRVTAPDPVIRSDVLHSQTFAAGETHTIHNAGTLTARVAWWVQGAPSQLVVEHLDYPAEYIRFPIGPTTTTTGRQIIGPAGAYGVAYGRNNTQLAQWPLLRPGDNEIRCSKACTLYWRDTW